jgi:integrase
MDSDMRYLTQPRGTGFVFRMVTPPELIGVLCPWTDKPFRKEIKHGLRTRHRAEARQKRDLVLGKIRELQLGVTDAGKFSADTAREIRADIAKLRQTPGNDDKVEAMEGGLSDILYAAERRGVALNQLKPFAKVALGDGMLLSDAVEQCIKDRSPNSKAGLKVLAPTTVAALRTAVGYLKEFMGDADDTLSLADVSDNDVRAFVRVFLRDVRTVRAPNGLSRGSIDKQVTMLKGLWAWAEQFDYLAPDASSIWNLRRSIPQQRPDDAISRDTFTPEELKALVAPLPIGHRGGDLLRLALATGCRCDEIAVLKTTDVGPDAEYFMVPKGKTKNARRIVPLVPAIRSIIADRITAHAATGRIFPDWPIRPASGKAAALSQWFTHYRRKRLGRETDGRLTFHCLRHTWRTAARRADIPQADIDDLGGWSGEKRSDKVYDHGRLLEQLAPMQERIWEQLVGEGFSLFANPHSHS